MKSMTGYGKSKAYQNEIDVEIEIKSINGRYLDLRIYLPRDLSFFEYYLRKRISSSLSRGTVEIRVNFTDHREPKIQLNLIKLNKYFDIVQKARVALHLNDDVSLEFLLNEPGIIESAHNLDEDSDLGEILKNTLENALVALESTLCAEADNIRNTIKESTDTILNNLESIETEVQPYKEELFSNLKNRTADILKSHSTENLEQRLFQELAIYIDKYDIHEELSRLRSHISTLLQTMESKDDIGKSLNFILQEMQREANTLGSKFSTAKTFKYILIIKEEVEKCREIVQNVA